MSSNFNLIINHVIDLQYSSMPINELRSISMFAKAVELGSIRKAAQAQGVSAQAATQAIAMLEKHLGVRLLHRTTRSLSLTEEGQQFLEDTQPALATLERAVNTARAGKEGIGGPLRIVGPKSSFASILMPLLSEFCQQHPEVRPDVELDDGIGNWVLDRVDVGFRIGESAQDGVISRRLFPIQLIVCASPEYLARYGMPTTTEELSAHRCSMFRHPVTGKVSPWYLTVDGKVEQRHLPSAFYSNDTELELQAVLAGLVIGQVANISAAPHIRAGKLVPLLLSQLSTPISLHLYYGSRHALPVRVRAFLDLALEKLRDTPALVLSEQELAAAQEKFRQIHLHGK
ncbi:LysR family transcriptional regulator [Chromobacterium subtsugae]|uniref:LysR family transcriptional regulator n=1 Tax=Chromobacterium subtsugae TaxID=251747 RepID=UPI000AB3BC0A|nr:LysR family transcriptional regulator [Chromobacterium subtsugae]